MAGSSSKCKKILKSLCSLLLVISVCVCLIAWLFQVYPWMWEERKAPVPPVSYDGVIKFNLENLRTPCTEEEIVDIVKDAYKNERKIRVLGDGHSWSEIAQTEDIMISLANYTGVVRMPLDTHATGPVHVTVKAGTPLNEISEFLDGKGLAMINLGSVAGQSIAGAISTGTHGTGLTVGNLASLVVGLRFVSGKEGEIVTVSVKDNPSLFRAAQVSIGMFGVITEVTLKVQKKFKLKEYRTLHSLDYCMDNLDGLVQGSHKYVKMWVEFYNNYCVLFQTHETDPDEPITPVPKWEAFFTYYSFAIATRLTHGRLFPSLTRYVMWLVTNVGFHGEEKRVDKSYKIFNDYFDLPIHQEGEIVVHYKDTVTAVRRIQQLVLDHNLPVNYMTEVRFVQGDDIHLSPHHGYDPGVCAITLTIYQPGEVALDYFNKVYEATKDLQARFHWGKHFNHDLQQIQGLFNETFDEFVKLREEMDPKGIFLNEFLKKTFQFEEGGDN